MTSVVTGGLSTFSGSSEVVNASGSRRSLLTQTEPPSWAVLNVRGKGVHHAAEANLCARTRVRNPVEKDGVRHTPSLEDSGA